MACLPILVPGWSSSSAGTPEEGSGLSLRAQALQRGLTGTCFVQASIATLQFAMSDAIGGLIGCTIAMLGLQAASPQGVRLLPSYIVLAFCNGTMQVLLGIELASAQGLLFTKVVPVSLKLAVALGSPVVMFLGLSVAWHLHCELRALAMQALPQRFLSAQLGAAAGDAPGTGGVGQPPAREGGGAQLADAVPPLLRPSGFRPFGGAPHRLLEVQ